MHPYTPYISHRVCPTSYYFFLFPPPQNEVIYVNALVQDVRNQATFDFPKSFYERHEQHVAEVRAAGIDMKILDLSEYLPPPEVRTKAVANVSASTLRRYLRRNGFKFGKHGKTIHLAKFSKQVAMKKTEYLREYATLRYQAREEGKIFRVWFLDEVAFNVNMQEACTWYDPHDPATIRLAPTGKGQRIVVLGCGGDGGWLEGSFVTFEDGGEKADYHGTVTSASYMTWAEDRLFPNLPKTDPATGKEILNVIVIDNAAPHTQWPDDVPNSTTSRADNIKWLLEVKGLEELREVLEIPVRKAGYWDAKTVWKKVQEERKGSEYLFDRRGKELGFHVLRLPPYHPELNPIELIWARMKYYARNHVHDYNITEQRKIVDEARDSVDAQLWMSCCLHVDRVRREMGVPSTKYHASNQLFITIGSESDSDSDEDETDGDDTKRMGMDEGMDLTDDDDSDGSVESDDSDMSDDETPLAAFLS